MAVLVVRLVAVAGGLRRSMVSRRDLFESPCHHFARLSYGPKMDNLCVGLDAIERVLNKQRTASHLLGKG
jgi:hypothetical protein